MSTPKVKFTNTQGVIIDGYNLVITVTDNSPVKKANNKELVVVFEYPSNDPYLSQKVAWGYNNDEPTKGTHWIYRPLHKYCREYIPNTYRAIVDCSIVAFPKIQKEIVDHWVRFHGKIAQKNRELENFFNTLP